MPYFDLHHTVTEEEIDAQGHVHNLRYLAWTLRAAGRHSEACGWDAQRMQSERGLGWVVRSHEATYRAAALFGDELIVRTWISDIARHAATRRSLICRPRDQATLARVTTRWAMVDLRQRRVAAIPAVALERMQLVEGTAPLPWEERGG